MPGKRSAGLWCMFLYWDSLEESFAIGLARRPMATALPAATTRTTDIRNASLSGEYIRGKIMNAARETADIAIRKSGTVQPNSSRTFLCTALCTIDAVARSDMPKNRQSLRSYTADTAIDAAEAMARNADRRTYGFIRPVLPNYDLAKKRMLPYRPPCPDMLHPMVRSC